MAFRSTNHWKQMSTALRGYATSTSPKMKPYSPAAGATEKTQQSNFKRFMRGDFVPVYVVVGMIAVSVGLGLHTAKQHLKHNPHVYVKKERRETLPEVVEPERVVAESDKFVKNSFFRKVAHVQELTTTITPLRIRSGKMFSLTNPTRPVREPRLSRTAE